MGGRNPFNDDYVEPAASVAAGLPDGVFGDVPAAKNPFSEEFVASDDDVDANDHCVEPIKLITEPGIYPDIDGEFYHRVEICDSPSISSTGLKQISRESAFHYWSRSPLNPNRPAPVQKQHFNVGKGVHDLLLLQDLFPKQYLILPEGFDARLKRWETAKEERKEAIRSGIPVLSHEQAIMVYAMAEQVEKNELAKALIMSGTPEMTLAAKDPVTGVWIRAKPDILPDTMEIIPDIKTAISAHPDAFEKAATKFGYFESAAHYVDIIDIIAAQNGEAAMKRRFVLIVVESAYPHAVQLYHLDDEAIQHGRMLNRAALNLFAQCIRTNEWPAYSTAQRPILPLQMTAWAQAQISRRIDSGELSWES